MRSILAAGLLMLSSPVLATIIGLTLELESSSGDPANNPFAPFVPPQSVIVEFDFDESTADLVPDPFFGGYTGTMSTSIDFYQGAGGTGTFRGGLQIQPNPPSGIAVFNDSGPGAIDGVFFVAQVNVGLTGLITASGVFDPYQGEEYTISLTAAFLELFSDDSLANITQDIFDQPSSNISQDGGGIQLQFDVAAVGNIGSYEIVYRYTPSEPSGVPLPMPLMLIVSGLLGLRFLRDA